MMARDREAGLTLVEMLVALVLFTLVGIASFTTLDAIIRTRDRTEGRLEAIARYDRALRLFSRDVMQSAPEDIALRDDGLVLSGSGGRILTWSGGTGVVLRQVQSPGTGPGMRQSLLEDIAGLQLRVMDDTLTWFDSWPPADTEADARAVEMTIDLGDGRGSLVRLAETARPVPPPQTFELTAPQPAGAASPDATAPTDGGN
ncbi:general secretion pathway protein J [Loktanella atrilutea]|uniref:General secretion pathway protein J n=2 Tax=Loktanella atrilutea TaxID=366533 RepID=A0A1M5FZ64_LOKAT|nr:prepilin-type N-terminal cleavage/methylation domain-containing protein [Loktanella atrilutea]SHF96756.1 general secretion pathway protein J [Loktanella atrilutea]